MDDYDEMQFKRLCLIGNEMLLHTPQARKKVSMHEVG